MLNCCLQKSESRFSLLLFFPLFFNTANQCGQSDINRLIEEKASTESQVNFLNSIIVDLHAKNAELESRVRAMLVGTDEQLE